MEDGATVGSYNVAEEDFLVVMVVRICIYIFDMLV